MRCSALPCSAVWCSVLQCVVACYSATKCVGGEGNARGDEYDLFVTVRCISLQQTGLISVCCGVLQCAAVCCCALEEKAAQRVRAPAHTHCLCICVSSTDKIMSLPSPWGASAPPHTTLTPCPRTFFLCAGRETESSYSSASSKPHGPCICV